MRRVQLLGPAVQVAAAGTAVRVDARKPAALLALLAACGGRRQADELAAELWPGASRTEESSALKVVVARTNRLAPDGGVGRLVVNERGDYRFGDRVEVDCLRFEREVSAALELGSSLAAMRALLDEWPGGPCPADWADLPSVVAYFRRLGVLRLELLVRYLDASLRASARPEVEHLVIAGLEIEPYDERLWSLLIQIRYRHARQEAALRAYDEARTRLVEDLGVEPGPELRAVHNAVLRHDPSLRHPDGVEAADPDGRQATGNAPLAAVMASVVAALADNEVAEAEVLLDSLPPLVRWQPEPDEPTLLRLELLRAELAVLSGRRGDAEVILDQVVARAIELDHLPILVDAAIGPAALGSAGILGRSTDHERLQAAHEHIGDRECPRVIELRSRLLRAARRAGDHPRYDHLAPSLLRAARESGVATDLAHALYAAHKARYPFCDPQGELEGLREAEVLAANRDTELWVLAVQAQAVVQVTAGRVEAGRDTNERALHVAVQAALPRRVWDSMTLEAALAACDGDLVRSNELAGQAYAYGTDYDLSDAFGTYAMQQFVVMWQENRVADLAAAIVAVDGVEHAIPSLVAARGLVASAQGDRAAALEALAGCCALLETNDVDDHRLSLLCLAAQLAVDAEAEPAQAAWLLGRLVDHAGTVEVNLSFALGPVDRHIGALQGLVGDPTDAMARLARTAETCAASGWALWEAWSLFDLARVAFAAGAPGAPGASDAVERAERLAEAHGLHLVAARAAALREAAGGGDA